jgi:hypothetical protein
MIREDTRRFESARRKLGQNGAKEEPGRLRPHDKAYLSGLDISASVHMLP